MTTYGVFGDECLLGTVKDENSHGTPCQATTVAESKAGVVVLSVSLAEVTLILGPIQELLSRVVNLKVLRWCYQLCPNVLHSQFDQSYDNVVARGLHMGSG